MTAPIPPSKPPPPIADAGIAGLVLAASESQRIDREKSHALTLAIIAIACIVVFALTGKSMGDAEAEAKAWHAKADTAVTEAAHWKVSEWKTRDAMRKHIAADSLAALHVVRYAIPAPRVIHDTRVVHDTVPPLAPAVPLPEPPPGQPLILASVYDAQGKACTRERRDCAAALAASDSAQRYLQKLAGDATGQAAAEHRVALHWERKDRLHMLEIAAAAAAACFVAHCLSHP